MRTHTSTEQINKRFYRVLKEPVNNLVVGKEIGLKLFEKFCWQLPVRIMRKRGLKFVAEWGGEPGSLECEPNG